MASISITNMSLVTIWAEKKMLDDRPGSWASFPHKDRGVKYVQRIFSQRKIIVRKKKEKWLAQSLIKTDIEKNYGVCIKYTKQLNLKESCYKSFCKKIRNNFLIWKHPVDCISGLFKLTPKKSVKRATHSGKPVLTCIECIFRGQFVIHIKSPKRCMCTTFPFLDKRIYFNDSTVKMWFTVLLIVWKN